MIGMILMRINSEEKRIRESYHLQSGRLMDHFMEEFFAIQELEEELYEERKEFGNCLKEGFCGRSDWDKCNDKECGMHILMN